MWLLVYTYIHLFFLWPCGPTRAMASSFLRFLDHTQRRITVGRISLDEWSARQYTTLNIDIHPCPGGIRTHNPSKRAAVDPRLRPRGSEIGIYRVSQEECAKLRESVPYVKVYRYNPKHLYPKLNGYGDNGRRSLKLWQLLHTYWLPNTY